MSRKDQSLGTDSRLVVARAGGRRSLGLAAMGPGFPAGGWNDLELETVVDARHRECSRCHCIVHVARHFFNLKVQRVTLRNEGERGQGHTSGHKGGDLPHPWGRAAQAALSAARFLRPGGRRPSSAGRESHSPARQGTGAACLRPGCLQSCASQL